MEVKFDNDILLVSPLSPQNNYGQFFLEGIEKPLLLDNGLNYKMLPLECSYTVGSVTNEGDTNKYWTALSRSAHIYETTYTRSDFSLNGGAVQVTGTGQYEGVSAEVFYSTMAGAVNTGTVCPKNDTAMVTLTGSQGAIVVCSHVLKSKADFNLLIRAVAFPYILITQDVCLGWSSANLGSCLQESSTGRLTKWDTHKFL